MKITAIATVLFVLNSIGFGQVLGETKWDKETPKRLRKRTMKVSLFG